jgi:hypothetical protein
MPSAIAYSRDEVATASFLSIAKSHKTYLYPALARLSRRFPILNASFSTQIRLELLVFLQHLPPFFIGA